VQLGVDVGHPDGAVDADRQQQQAADDEHVLDERGHENGPRSS
jgi:hypothetical protein